MHPDQALLARIRDVPGRATTALLLFGGMLGVPAVLSVLAALVGDAVPALAALFVLLACACFVGVVVFAGVALATSYSRLRQAEADLYAGDFASAVQKARRTLRTVFRADHRAAATYVLALTAERMGAFADSAKLFPMALAAMPLMSAQGPGRRVRALTTAHTTLALAALGDVAGAQASLAQCHRELASPAQGGLMSALVMDDTAFGAVGVNALLTEMEGRRDPRPVAALAGALLALRAGDGYAAIDLVTREGATFAHGLAPHEGALLMRIQEEAHRLLMGSDPHRAPARLELSVAPHPWVDAVFPRRG